MEKEIINRFYFILFIYLNTTEQYQQLRE